MPHAFTFHSCGVIVESPHSQGEFVSSIFVRLKKNGVDYRMILKLKELNKFIVYRHFKMDSLKTVIDLMSQGCYMVSVDIKDAYYTVPIATEHQNFLKFRWRDKLYQYTCLPNGLASAPRIFTKLLKPVFNILRQKGYLSSSYIDDCYLQGATYGECHDNGNAGKNSSKQSRGDPGGALLDLPKLVSQISETIGSSSIDDHSQGSPPDSFRVPETSPIEKKAESVSLSFVRRPYKNRAFSERATNIVLQSWRQSSKKQYDAHIRKWLLLCTKRQADPICPTISVAVDFLTSLHDEGLSYSSINSARCARSAILESPASAYPTFGEHPDIKRFMNGIFQSRPPLPRYCKTWDVNLVLQYIGSMGNSQELSLKDLTLKLVMLVALTTAQRGQSLQLLDTQNMVQEETAYTFMLNSNLKQSKPGKSTSDLVIKLIAYPYDRNLCVVNACSVYLAKTTLLRGSESRLFITHQKPHKKASRDTIRRWIQQMMIKAGIDINVYKPHSVRSAATSKAKAANASLVEIMQTAGWSSAATFATFYDREIEQGSSFSDSVLSLS
ncbi:uncharacterized protein [Montipora foliosa]|uniref:uncharacterized protein n=1 Tax=Montipora foliosa TaxID=591990 RepID=UPI0035F1970A